MSRPKLRRWWFASLLGLLAIGDGPSPGQNPRRTMPIVGLPTSILDPAAGTDPPGLAVLGITPGAASRGRRSGLPRPRPADLLRSRLFVGPRAFFPGPFRRRRELIPLHSCLPSGSNRPDAEVGRSDPVGSRPGNGRSRRWVPHGLPGSNSVAIVRGATWSPRRSGRRRRAWSSRRRRLRCSRGPWHSPPGGSSPCSGSTPTSTTPTSSRSTSARRSITSRRRQGPSSLIPNYDQPGRRVRLPDHRGRLALSLSRLEARAAGGRRPARPLDRLRPALGVRGADSRRSHRERLPGHVQPLPPARIGGDVQRLRRVARPLVRLHDADGRAPAQHRVADLSGLRRKAGQSRRLARDVRPDQPLRPSPDQLARIVDRVQSPRRTRLHSRRPSKCPHERPDDPQLLGRRPDRPHDDRRSMADQRGLPVFRFVARAVPAVVPDPSPGQRPYRRAVTFRRGGPGVDGGALWPTLAAGLPRRPALPAQGEGRPTSSSLEARPLGADRPMARLRRGASADERGPTSTCSSGRSSRPSASSSGVAPACRPRDSRRPHRDPAGDPPREAPGRSDRSTTPC